MTRSRHVVVVDDEPNIGRSLRLILEGAGYRVTFFESAARFHARLEHVKASRRSGCGRSIRSAPEIRLRCDSAST